MTAPNAYSESNSRTRDESTPPARCRARTPLFSGWWLVAAALAAETTLLLWLWPAVSVSGWSLRLLAFTTGVATLGTYVIGETTRQRGRASLRVWFAGLALASVLSVILARQILLGTQQREHVRAIAARGGFIDYDVDMGYDQRFRTSDGLFLPKWLLNACGPECFGQAVTVTIELTRCDDELLRHLAQLPNLRSLSLRESQLDLAAIRALAALPALEELRLDGSELAADDLAPLATCSRLRVLSLERCKVSEETLERLRAELPNCWIEPRP